MDDKHLPVVPLHSSPVQTRFGALLAFVLVAAATSATYLFSPISSTHHASTAAPVNAQAILDTCSGLHTQVEVPSNFALRTESDRYERGTRALLVKNATVWTGNHDGKEVLHNTDVFLDKGIIKFIGKFRRNEVGFDAADYDVLDAAGSWLTPG